MTDTIGDHDDPRVLRTRRDVGDAVRELIAEEGWDGVTHQRVAERSGYSRNTLYRHFPERSDLFVHGANFGDELTHAELSGELRTDLIAEMLAFRAALFDGPIGVVLAVMMERAEQDPELVPMRDRLVEQGCGPTRELLGRAAAEGRLRADRTIDEACAALSGPLVYARLCQGRRPPDREVARLIDTVLD